MDSMVDFIIPPKENIFLLLYHVLGENATVCRIFFKKTPKIMKKRVRKSPSAPLDLSGSGFFMDPPHQQPPQQQRNSRTMRTIQIQLLLSNTLHRQLFIQNLLKYEVGDGFRPHYQNMSKRHRRAWNRRKIVGLGRTLLKKNWKYPLTNPGEWYIIYTFAGIV